MFKLAILGNSHIGCLKGSLPDWDDITVTFFGAPARHAHLLKVADNGYIRPTTKRGLDSFIRTSNGSSCLDINQYDAVWIFGLLPSKENANIHFNYWSQPKNNKCYSIALREKSDIYYNSIVREVVRIIRKNWCDMPIFISPKPVPAAGSSKALNINGSNYYEDLRSRLVKENIQVLEQPNSTLTSSGFTNRIYTKGSKPLDTYFSDNSRVHNQDDYTHMNNHFGEVYWKNVKEELFSNRNV